MRCGNLRPLGNYTTITRVHGGLSVKWGSEIHVWNSLTLHVRLCNARAHRKTHPIEVIWLLVLFKTTPLQNFRASNSCWTHSLTLGDDDTTPQRSTLGWADEGGHTGSDWYGVEVCPFFILYWDEWFLLEPPIFNHCRCFRFRSVDFNIQCHPLYVNCNVTNEVIDMRCVGNVRRSFLGFC